MDRDAIRKHYDRLDQVMLDASKALNESVSNHERMRTTLLDVQQGAHNLRQQLDIADHLSEGSLQNLIDSLGGMMLDAA